MDKLEFYLDTELRWRWRITAKNNRVIDASHQSFATKWSAKRNYKRARRVPKEQS